MNKVLKELIVSERKSQAKWDERMRQHAVEHAERTEIKGRDIMPNVTRARPGLYKRWLRGYIAKGGIPTHYYNYDLPDTFYRAVRSFTLSPLFGSGAINIIVPKGIIVSGHTGHCNVYYMDGFKADGWGPTVPVYRNTIV